MGLVFIFMQPADRFGSPSTEDLDTFVRGFNSAFEAALGEELASDIAVEVPSPVSAQPELVCTNCQQQPMA